MKQSPKEKAKELFNKMYQAKDILLHQSMDKYQAKQCALIAVDEILNTNLVSHPKTYWQEVKQEIQKL